MFYEYRHPVSGAMRRAFRIVVVDDHAMVRQGLKSRLQNYSHLELVGDGEESVTSSPHYCILP